MLGKKPSSHAAPFALALTTMALFPTFVVAALPPIAVVGGATWETPFHGAANVRGDYGMRLGLSCSTVLPAGELRLPMEIGLTLRTASLGFTDYFDRAVFTDLQLPLIFHGPLPAWRRWEWLALWTPSYTLDMVSTSPHNGRVDYTDALRTRFNMGFGGGLQVSALGVRLRSFWVYNIFSPFPASNLTFSDLGLEVAIPLFGRKCAP